ncbi:hypothetical protein [Methylococcus sp. EFPC2]|uniref:hypothetical protein n=1 Tax=Methylococcus sp. EFPC2 TaxID=2812648 RepID=UPI0019672955|nr:hypothetical protein [Methylococcus sp. EFPC2]QSA97132.1 hypothetical protein JWZ97_18390 [Methylococcus sp. EFPC2]
MTMMTVQAYAQHRRSAGLAGCTRQAVEKAIAGGRISIVDGRIDPATADAEWERNTRKRADLHSRAGLVAMPVTTLPVSAKPTTDWSDHKARKEAAEASLKEQELARRSGELVDRRGMERAAHETARVLRDALIDTLPSKISMELAAMTDPWQVECRLREAIRAELYAIVDGLSGREPQHAA